MISSENSKKLKKWRQETPKVRKSSARASKSEPKGTKSEPKGTKSEPKGSQSDPKGSQRAAKVSQREPKGSQKWAKGRPKCIKKSNFGKGREKGAKRLSASRWNGSFLGAIFHQKSIKKRCGNRCRKSRENWRKSVRKRDRNSSGIWLFSKGRFAKKRVLWKRCKHANHYIHAVESGSGRVRRKRRKSKKERNLRKYDPKIIKTHARKSDAEKYEQMMKHESKNGSRKSTKTSKNKVWKWSIFGSFFRVSGVDFFSFFEVPFSP